MLRRFQQRHQQGPAGTVKSMANTFFRLKQFTVHQQHAAMKVTTDACLAGAWMADQLQKEKETFLHALDIGAGTGLLSLMVAQKNDVKIDAVEIDSGAAQQARENFALSPWAERLHLIEGNINTYSSSKKYDCTFSNPPFYEAELQSPNATRNVAHHSQQLKLEALFAIIADKLHANGIFFLLLPYKRKSEIERLLPQSGLHIHTLVEVKPSELHAPFRLLIKGSKAEKHQKEIETFSIKDAAGQYTPAFEQLLKDYYLYL